MRDYSKALNSKMYYTGTNAAMHKRPELYIEAVLHGLKQEKASRLL